MSTTTVPPLAGVSGRRALATAGSAYVAAWVIGLATAPAAPGADAADATIQRFYAGHGAATLFQATLVHGIAGVALAVFVVALARRVAPAGVDSLRTVLVAAGLAAAAVSLLQYAMEIGLNRVAGSGHVSNSATLFHAVNVADTLKLVLLAVAIAAATRPAAGGLALPRWVRGLGWVLPPVLVVGGAAFVINSDGLSAVLAVSLVLLLLWVGAVTYAVTRGGRLRPPRGVAA
jgi:hypothetical protein